jgi:hypothetical protein
MTTPEVMLCPDGHYRRIVFGIGPYIADYPEQALLACIVQGWCARWVFNSCNIFEYWQLNIQTRCTAPATNLDGPEGGRRTFELTELLVSELELRELWDNYGLVGDIVVCFTTNSFNSCLSITAIYQ